MPDRIITVNKQLDFLASELSRMEALMIDPIEFGELKGAVSSLRRDADTMAQKQTQMDQKLDLVLERLSEAKGGWRALMLLGGAGATLGGAITWFFSHSITIGPKG